MTTAITVWVALLADLAEGMDRSTGPAGAALLVLVGLALVVTAVVVWDPGERHPGEGPSPTRADVDSWTGVVDLRSYRGRTADLMLLMFDPVTGTIAEERTLVEALACVLLADLALRGC